MEPVTLAAQLGGIIFRAIRSQCLHFAIQSAFVLPQGIKFIQYALRVGSYLIAQALQAIEFYLLLVYPIVQLVQFLEPALELFFLVS